MTQQQHQEDTRVDRLGPSELYDEEERSAPPLRNRVHRRSRGGGTFYGWLVAIGLTALLTGIAGAIAAAVDYSGTFDWYDAMNSANTAGTIGIVSGVLLLLILGFAYYHGGYVAGRLAGSAGALHGFGVWLIGIVVTAIVAVLAGTAGSQYDVLDRMKLPSVPIADQTLTLGGLIAVGAAALITLVAAVMGGKAGRSHDDIETSAD
jgi:heme/copper-type cytochrome/quinol oxidase subunit 1